MSFKKKSLFKKMEYFYKLLPLKARQAIKNMLSHLLMGMKNAKFKKKLSRQLYKLSIVDHDFDLYLKTLDHDIWNRIFEAHSFANVRGFIDLEHLKPWKVFLDELYEHIPDYSLEYVKQLTFSATCFRQNSCYMVDLESKYVNIVDGIRKTTGQPAEAKNSIHLFGASRVFGICNEDAHTFASFLQRDLNKNAPGAFRVWNRGIIAQTLEAIFLQLMSLDIIDGDHIFIFTRSGIEPSADSDIFRTLLAADEYCRNKKAFFHVVFLPTAGHVINPSPRERVFAIYQCLWLQQLMSKELIQSVTLRPDCPLDDYEPFMYKGTYQRNIWIDHKTGRPYTMYATGETPEFLRLDSENAMELLKKHGISGHNLLGVFDRPHGFKEMFIDPNHWGSHGNELVARELVNIISETAQTLPVVRNDSSEIFSQAVSRAVVSVGSVAKTAYGDKKDINDWLDSVEYKAFAGRKNIGAIVMNCNPFTLGHRHLVTRAAEKVDGLYLFVVQEDRSVFPFADRFKLVQEGVKDLSDKVHVIPSGNFIISSFSFADYFTKETAIEPADSTTDVLIFGAVIAPRLKITRRFVGEEPNCLVTQSYNKTMLFLLPDLGVEVEVMPRVEHNSIPISASVVRQALKKGDFETIKKIVPASTYQYLVDNKEKYQG